MAHMRWTKGRHAFFVATHTDRQHIHNHIYYNSTSLDCTRKFRDFLGSAFALRRLSDRVCLENGLSIIRNPKQHSNWAATEQFNTLLGGAKLPKMDKLKAEWQELSAKKKAAYKEYRAARSTMQEVLTVKANIDALLGDTRQEKNKEQER